MSQEKLSLHEDEITLALERIRAAFFAATLLIVFTCGLLFMAWRSNPDSPLVFLAAEPLLMLIFASWMLRKKSRIGATLLLVLFLSSKLVLILPLFLADIPNKMSALAPALIPQFLWIAIGGYYFINGIRGCFSFQELSLISASDPSSDNVVKKIRPVRKRSSEKARLK